MKSTASEPGLNFAMFWGTNFDPIPCTTSKLSVNDNLVPRVISPRFPICSRHIGKSEDPGDKFPKTFLAFIPACVLLGPILSPMINNFVCVASFSTLCTRSGCLFDHSRIYRKIDSKKGSSSTNGSKLAPFPVSDEMLLFVFNISHINYISNI